MLYVFYLIKHSRVCATALGSVSLRIPGNPFILPRNIHEAEILGHRGRGQGPIHTPLQREQATHELINKTVTVSKQINRVVRSRDGAGTVSAGVSQAGVPGDLKDTAGHGLAKSCKAESPNACKIHLHVKPAVPAFLTSCFLPF